MASNNAIDKMVENFKEISDLQAFAKAQQKTLIDITKKNKQLEDEIKHLKKLLEGSVPLIKAESKLIDFSVSDEESIAREQLYKLKELSHDRELTLEETKRVEIYSKLLMALKDKPKAIDITNKNITDNELMLVLTQNDKENDGNRE